MREENKYEQTEDPMFEYYRNAMNYDRCLEGNLLLWTEYLDNCLKDYVIRYNFNFFEVANRFHDFISFPYKYDFSEEECRFHWAFLHSARGLGITIDDDFYKELKKNHKNFSKKPKQKNEYTDVVEILDEELAEQSKAAEASKAPNIINVNVTNMEINELTKKRKEEKPEEEDLMKKILEINERNRLENLEREKENNRKQEELENDKLNAVKTTPHEQNIMDLMVF